MNRNLNKLSTVRTVRFLVSGKNIVKKLQTRIKTCIFAMSID